MSYWSRLRQSLTIRNFVRTKSTTDDGDATPPGPASFSDTEPAVRDDNDSRPLLGAVNEGPTSAELRGAGGLKRVLTLPDLLSYGVGSTVGAGIYTVVAVASALSGPSITIAFTMCCLACMCTGLVYAEFAVRIPQVCGVVFLFLRVFFFFEEIF